MKKIITLILFGLLLTCQPAMALDLSAAKAQGLVGETATGYLASVKANPEAQKLVDTINAKRKQHYVQISKSNNAPLNTVEQLAGQKAIEKTPAGQFVNVNGSWQKK